MELKAWSFEELITHPDFSALLKEYAEETAIVDINVNFEFYKKMEAAGILRTVVAVREDKLLGFILLSNTFLPNYSISVTVSNAIFVGKEYRKEGIGLKLIKEAELYSWATDTDGVFMGCPKNSQMSELLPRLDYIETSSLFLKVRKRD